MGQSQSKIPTRQIQTKVLLRKQPVEVGLHYYPFKQYSGYTYNEKQQTATLKISKPFEEEMKIHTKRYEELEKAVYEKTIDIELQHVLFDTFNFGRRFYFVYNLSQPHCMVMRKFKQYESQEYKHILYEQHMYENIVSLDCPNLIEIQDSFCINSNMTDPEPLTQFFIFEPFDTNLSQIIKYRRNNNCEWFISEFEKLVYDLVNAVYELHAANITHNDIRPCNVFYSLKKECYVLGQFGNSLKTDPQGNSLNVKVRTHPSFRVADSELKTEKLKKVYSNHKRNDVYSLGMTLLCAFYMVEPVERKLCAPINRGMEEKIDVIKVLRKMVQKGEGSLYIAEIKDEIKGYNTKSSMNNMVDSIIFRHKPKSKEVPMKQTAFSSAYKRLGLWDRWRDSLYESYETSEGYISDIEEAHYCKEISRVEKIKENHQIADEFGEKAAYLYWKIGAKYRKQQNFFEAEKTLNFGLNSLNNCLDQNKIIMVKILQSLSLLYAEKQQFTESKACLSESKRFFKRCYTETNEDYYYIMLKEAEIHQIHNEFHEAEEILLNLKKRAEKNSDQNQVIEILKRLGRNSLEKAEFSSNAVYSNILESRKMSPKNSLSNSQSLSGSHSLAERQNESKVGSSFVNHILHQSVNKSSYEQAEIYFLEASSLIESRTKAANRKRFSSEHGTDIEENAFDDIDEKNIVFQNLQIMKSLGQIKYKNREVQRAEDFFEKILAEIEKILEPEKFYQRHRGQNIQDGVLQTLQDDHLSEDSHSHSHSRQSKSQHRKRQKVKKIAHRAAGHHPHTSEFDPTVEPAVEIMNKGELLKMRADTECSVALCKQQQKQYHQSLTYYNRSLNSYKNYFGQYHNRICGVIIGSMSMAYHKTNQHSKAMSCLEIAQQILKEILPKGSPDLQHFKSMKKVIVEEQIMTSKNIEKSSFGKERPFQDQLDSILNLKKFSKPRKEHKKPSIAVVGGSDIPLASNQSSIVRGTDLQEIQEEPDSNIIRRVKQGSKQNQMRKQINQEEEQESYDSDASSVREVQMPLQVSYVKNDVQYRADEWHNYDSDHVRFNSSLNRQTDKESMIKLQSSELRDTILNKVDSAQSERFIDGKN